MEDIKLKEEDVDISDEIIQEFINFCQVGQIEIDDSNVFIHRQLAYRYDVPFLKDKIKKYFSDKISQNPQYINQICLRNLFKKENQPNYQDEYNDGYEWALKDDEEIISNNFFDVINDELILELDVPIIYRILNNHILNFKEMGETKQKQIIDFMFKYLKKHPKKASVLFINMDLKSIYIQLVNDYSDIFDFNMINGKSAIELIAELQNELEISKRDSSNQNLDILKEVNRQNEVIKKQQDELNIYAKEKERLYQLVSDFDLYTNDKEISIKEFNDFNGETQMFFIQKWKDNNSFMYFLSLLLTSLKNAEQEKNYQNQMKNYFNFESDTFIINSFYTNLLYENGSFNSKDFIELINKFSNVCFEIDYPASFEKKYDYLINIRNTKCPTLKLGVRVNKFENY